MPKLSRIQKKRIAVFCAAALAAWVIGMIPKTLSYWHNTSSILYLGILIAWALTVRRRVVQVDIRRLLTVASALMVSLFLARRCRYDYFGHSPAVMRYLWYAYYIPFTAVPLSGYLTALCVGKTEADRPLKRAKYLWFIEMLLCTAVLTNDLHQQAFRLLDLASEAYTHGWLYYVTVVWSVFFTLASFTVLMRRCRISAVRSLWYIPMLPATLGALLLVIYFAAGGSPVIYGIKLYNLHEAFCFLFVVLFEGCIQIGLIPSNSGYGELFRLSHINAAIRNSSGEIVYQAQNYAPATESEDVRIRRKAISGGEIAWTEDVTSINRLNADLQETADLLAAENTLLEEENKIKERTARIETQNRLYDEIALSVRPQLDRLDALLKDAERGGALNRDDLAPAAVLGAYVKRHSNLVLNADLSPTMSSTDLHFAIKETCEYLELSGLRCALMVQGKSELPSAFVILAYECFEAVLEAASPAAHAIMVDLSAADGFCMTVMADAPNAGLNEDWRQSELMSLGGTLRVFRDSDSIRVRLYGGKGAKP